MGGGSRFGILTTDPEDGRITKFTEKPEKPDSNLASMGIYIFSADVLIEALEEDALDQRSSHDFGKDIIPKLLGENKRLYSYEFHGFWKDVGTIASFHETSMDLLGNNPEFDLFDKHFPIMSNITTRPPHYIGPDAAWTTAWSPTAARSTAPLATRSFDRCHHRGARRGRGFRAAAGCARQERRAHLPRYFGRELHGRRGREARLCRYHQGYGRRWK